MCGEVAFANGLALTKGGGHCRLFMAMFQLQTFYCTDTIRQRIIFNRNRPPFGRIKNRQSKSGGSNTVRVYLESLCVMIILLRDGFFELVWPSHADNIKMEDDEKKKVLRNHIDSVVLFFVIFRFVTRLNNDTRTDNNVFLRVFSLVHLEYG